MRTGIRSEERLASKKVVSATYGIHHSCSESSRRSHQVLKYATTTEGEDASSKFNLARVSITISCLCLSTSFFFVLLLRHFSNVSLRVSIFIKVRELIYPRRAKMRALFVIAAVSSCCFPW